jgi:hypothetical protein
MIPDLLLNKLQVIFIGKDENGIEPEIAQEDPEGGISNYLIMYSPGVIFSGQIAGLDVNFISPMGDINGIVKRDWQSYEYNEVEDDVDYADLKANYGFDENKIIEGINNSDAGTYVLWFLARSCLCNMGI